MERTAAARVAVQTHVVVGMERSVVRGREGMTCERTGAYVRMKTDMWGNWRTRTKENNNTVPYTYAVNDSTVVIYVQVCTVKR